MNHLQIEESYSDESAQEGAIWGNCQNVVGGCGIKKIFRLPLGSSHSPKIAFCSSYIENPSLRAQQQERIEQHLKGCWSSFSGDWEKLTTQQQAEQRSLFHAALPLFSAQFSAPSAPCQASFSILSRYRPSAFQYFYNMISCWLIPGQRPYIARVHATDFRLPQLSEKIYTICEVELAIDGEKELEQIKKNLTSIAAEIRLGMHSAHSAHKIMELKGVQADQKTALLQQRIAHLIARHPHHFDLELLEEMRQLSIISSAEFKAKRSLSHLSRIISIHYLFRKDIVKAVGQEPQQRYFKWKFLALRGENNGVAHSVIGIILATNLLKKEEIFEQRHLLNAIQNHLPLAAAVPGSFFANHHKHNSIVTMYVEICKKDGTLFSKEELAYLHQELPQDVHNHIEVPIHPIFMPRNEEEVLRNIIQLSKELSSDEYPPQVMIIFDEQTHRSLFFTVIVLRSIAPHTSSIEQLFSSKTKAVEYIHDRTRRLNSSGEGKAKEASVFRLKMDKQPFLRTNYSVDLVKARQAIVSELKGVLGAFRDFNGGTLTKEAELFAALRHQLKGGIKYSEHLLEVFFHSLAPASLRSTIEPIYLKELFVLLCERHRQREKGKKWAGMSASSGETVAPQLYMRKAKEAHLVIIAHCSNRCRNQINLALQEHFLQKGQAGNIFVTVDHISYGGYILLDSSPEKEQLFCQLIQTNLE